MAENVNKVKVRDLERVQLTRIERKSDGQTRDALGGSNK